jgi:orotate phosphoribosyltransferase
VERTELATRIAAVSRVTGTFRLRSGKTSNLYFDKFQFESDPMLLRSIALHMAPLVPAETDVLAGLELGGIPVVTVLSQVTGLPAVFLRKAPKAYGTMRYAEGPPLAGRQVVLVEDVVSSGGAIVDQLAMLRADGIRPRVAICVIDREGGGRDALAAQGVELRALFTMSAIDAADAPVNPRAPFAAGEIEP